MTGSPRLEPYTAPAGGRRSTVVGDLRVLRGLPGPPHGPTRDVLVLLPPGAVLPSAGAVRLERRYPVLYMHDGQNLFDEATAYRDEWQVDETLARLAPEGVEAIVVGVPNAGDGRYAEYTPFKGRRSHAHGGLGRAYLQWVVDVVKPAIDAACPTRPEREMTGILGSSLGGLISLWAVIAHAGTFGLVGAMSTAITPGQNEVIRRLARVSMPPVRAYLDVGGHEANDAPSPGLERLWSAAAVREARQLRDALAAAGLVEGSTLRYVEAPDAIHRETEWARRLPEALRFLLQGADME